MATTARLVNCLLLHLPTGAHVDFIASRVLWIQLLVKREPTNRKKGRHLAIPVLPDSFVSPLTTVSTREMQSLEAKTDFAQGSDALHFGWSDVGSVHFLKPNFALCK